MKDDLVREVPTHVIDGREDVTAYTKRPSARGGWAAQVYAFRPDLAKADAERFVREFVEWRDSFKPRLTVADVRDALSCVAVSKRIRTFEDGRIHVDTHVWSLVVDGVDVVVSRFQADDAGAADLRDALKAIEAIEGLL